MPVPFLDLRAQYESLKPEIAAALQEVLSSSAFSNGPFVSIFEKAFAEYCGTRDCIGVNSGTSAITLLLKAHGIGKGDEVITQANSFFASAEAISHTGATPVLVDVLENTGQMNPLLLEKAITKKTKALLPVHIYGQCGDFDAILAIGKRHNLLVFEDAAQAHGARHKGKRAGSLADGATFSFYAGKNLGAYGEAGAIMTNDAAIADTLRMMREHGSRKKYEHELIGWNERMDGIQGAVLSVKLKYLDEWNAKRRKHAEHYHVMLGSLEAEGKISFIETLQTCEPVYHLFVIRSAKRDALKAHLEKHGIGVGIHYPIPIHLQKAYADLGYKKGDFPVAEKLASEVLSLPMYAELTEKQIEEVCEAIKSFV